MEWIRNKKEIQAIGVTLADTFYKKGIDAMLRELHVQVLQKKLRFPLLEALAEMLFDYIPADEHYKLCDGVMDLREIGSNVIAGKLLQKHLPGGIGPPLEKAISYMPEHTEWYVCDIIGERVPGHALLVQPGHTIPLLKTMLQHESNMVVRAVGVSVHYAVKKGLPKQYIGTLYELLLTMADARNHHVKRGIGWGAKTIAKFHPHIITAYGHQIDKDDTGQWFRTK